MAGAETSNGDVAIATPFTPRVQPHKASYIYVRVYAKGECMPEEHDFPGTEITMTQNIIKFGISICMKSRDQTYGDDKGIFAYCTLLPSRAMALSVEQRTVHDMSEARIARAGVKCNEYLDLGRCAALLGSMRPDDPLEVARDLMRRMVGTFLHNWPSAARDIDLAYDRKLIAWDASHGAWEYITPLLRRAWFNVHHEARDPVWQPSVGGLLGVEADQVVDMASGMKGSMRKKSSPLVRMMALVRLLAITDAEKCGPGELDALDEKIQRAYTKHMAGGEFNREFKFRVGTSALLRGVIGTLVGEPAVRSLSEGLIECAETSTHTIDAVMESDVWPAVSGLFEPRKASTRYEFLGTVLRVAIGIEMKRAHIDRSDPARERWTLRVSDHGALHNTLVALGRKAAAPVQERTTRAPARCRAQHSFKSTEAGNAVAIASELKAPEIVRLWFNAAKECVSRRKAEHLLKVKFGLDENGIADAKGPEDSDFFHFFRWSVICKIARVGNPNFKKFKRTAKFKNRVTPELVDTCKRDGGAHMLSANVALEVLRMCDKLRPPFVKAGEDGEGGA